MEVFTSDRYITPMTDTREDEDVQQEPSVDPLEVRDELELQQLSSEDRELQCQSQDEQQKTSELESEQEKQDMVSHVLKQNTPSPQQEHQYSNSPLEQQPDATPQDRTDHNLQACLSSHQSHYDEQPTSPSPAVDKSQLQQPLQATTPSSPQLDYQSTPPLQHTLTPHQHTPSPQMQNTPPLALQNTPPPLQNTPPPMQSTPPPMQNTPPPMQNTPSAQPSTVTPPPLQHTPLPLQHTPTPPLHLHSTPTPPLQQTSQLVPEDESSPLQALNSQIQSPLLQQEQPPEMEKECHRPVDDHHQHQLRQLQHSSTTASSPQQFQQQDNLSSLSSLQPGGSEMLSHNHLSPLTSLANNQLTSNMSAQQQMAHLGLPPLASTPNNMSSMIQSASSTSMPSGNNNYCDNSNMRSQNDMNMAMHNASHMQENGHSSSSDIQNSHSRPNSVYDFDATSNSDMSMVNMDNTLMIASQQQHQQHNIRQLNLPHNSSKDNYSLNSLPRCNSLPTPKRDDVLPHMGPMNHMQRPPEQPQNSMNNTPSGMSSNESLNQSYDNSMSVSSSEFPNTASCYDPVLMRRGRGRPRGSKNGTGMGRGRNSFSGRGGYRFAGSDDRTCTAYDLRHIPDPFGTARRGRPRSRFIVDLGEQNHEAWTKARLDLNVSDAELTTLLLSLLESRRDLEDAAESDTMLGLIGSEYNKWKEKFASQVSMLSHFASIHNTNCSTCLGIKKKKLPTVGTGKRGRPRKYPPPVGYGPGMQRPDTIDEDGNIFEPQCILKDGTIVKAEPHDEKPKLQSGGDGGPEGSNSSSSNGPMASPMGGLPPRAMLTQEEMQKRREYYSNHKNKIKYVCHYCQVHFYHKPNFDYHISKLEREGKCRVYDKVNNLYLCEACGEGFSWREKLEKHLRLAEQHGTHNQKELLIYGDFQCIMCGKTFNKRNTYLQHIKWHEDREDVPCVICATMFKQTELRRHLMEVHNNDSLPCCYCGKLFTSRKYLEKHEMVHQAGNFPCPECGKCFSQKMAMQHHLRSHSLDKEYSCETCGQMFTQRMGLCHHLRKQFGSAEFSQECEVCTTYFCNAYDMQVHKRKVHNMAPEEMDEELPPESYLPLNMRGHPLSPQEDRSKAYNDANNVVKSMLGATLGNALESSVNMAMKHEGNEPMDDSQVQINDDQLRDNSLRDQSIRGNSMNDIMRNNPMRDNLIRESAMRENPMRENSMRDEQMRDDPMREDVLRNLSRREDGMRNNPMQNDSLRESSMRESSMRESHMREENMRNNSLRDNSLQENAMRDNSLHDDHMHDDSMGDDPMRDNPMRDNPMRNNPMRDGLLRENPFRELAMRGGVGEGDTPMRDDPMRENALLMNEHMRHMVERRDLDPEEQQLRLNPALHNMHQQQGADDHLHMPQDLTRMAAHLADNDRNNSGGGSNSGGGGGGGMLSGVQQHMSELRQQQDSPGRLSDTPAAGHMSDHLGRMAVENFNRMTGTPGGYLAEHIRRIAENQSRNAVASVVSDTAAVMAGHYDDRDYTRIDNLRSMSRASPADPMSRLGDNLSHMGVIRPAQTPSSTPQWPPHMQNHSPLDGMNQSSQSSQHALYPLPFWPYDPSLRHYNH